MIDPTNIPPHMFPLPEGYVLLGTGDQFQHDRNIEGYVIHATNRDGWTSVRYGLGSVNLAYAVPAGSALALRNPDIVALLNHST